MKCFKCNSQQDDNSNFCAFCGMNLRQQQNPQEQQNPQQQEQQNPQQQEPQNQQQQIPPQYYAGQPYNQPPQGYSPYNQYGQYGHTPPPYINEATSKATNSMVLGIISIVTLFLCCIGIFLAIPGLVMGVNSKRTLSAANVQQGQGQATAGIVLSSITIAIAVIYLFVFMLGRYV